MTKEMEQPFVQLPIPNYLPMEKPEFLETEEERKSRENQEESDENPRVIIIDI
mgnify:CR=1